MSGRRHRDLRRDSKLVLPSGQTTPRERESAQGNGDFFSKKIEMLEKKDSMSQIANAEKRLTNKLNQEERILKIEGKGSSSKQ